MRLIDADRALEIVRDQGIAHPNAYHLTKYATLILREAPTIEAEPVRNGRWVKVKCKKEYWGLDSDGDFGCWEDYPILCSSCHYDLTENGARETNYCPNCGAKMDKEE